MSDAMIAWLRCLTQRHSSRRMTVINRDPITDSRFRPKVLKCGCIRIEDCTNERAVRWPMLILKTFRWAENIQLPRARRLVFSKRKRHRDRGLAQNRERVDLQYLS